MNSLKSIFKLILTFIILVLLTSLILKDSDDDVNYISIEALINSNKLETQIIGLGGHQENCIQFNLKNLTSDTLFIGIEPGRRLTSMDTTMQDILIVKEKNIKLLPKEDETFKGYGFCCQSSNHSPAKNSKFKIGYIAPPEWLKLARIINGNSFPSGAIQSAIWVLSDSHSVSSIHANDITSIKLLRETVADIKGVELPWYTLDYIQDTSILFSNKPDNVFGRLNYYLRNNTIVTINVRAKNGQLAASIIREIPLGRGNHSYDLILKVKGWPKGKYDVFIYEDHGKLNLKKSFEL